MPVPAVFELPRPLAVLRNPFFDTGVASILLHRVVERVSAIPSTKDHAEPLAMFTGWSDLAACIRAPLSAPSPEMSPASALA